MIVTFAIDVVDGLTIAGAEQTSGVKIQGIDYKKVGN